MGTPHPRASSPFPILHQIHCHRLYHHYPSQLESVPYLGTRKLIHRSMITQLPHAPNWCKRPMTSLLHGLSRRLPDILAIRSQMTQRAPIKIPHPHQVATHLMTGTILAWQPTKVRLSYMVRTFYHQPAVMDILDP